MTTSKNADAVLVLDGDMVPALSVIRSLSRIGLIVDIASQQNKPVASYSRYVRHTLSYPDPLTQETAFIDWCSSVLDSSSYRLVLPVTERTVVPLAKLQNHPQTKKLAVPPAKALEIALDKAKTLELANSLGIASPQSILVECADDIRRAATDLTLPVVVKPARSIGSNDAGRKQLSVEYAFTKKELETKTDHFLHYGPVLLQEYISGQGVGIELIADQGKVMYAFQHLRLHEVPLTGGGSSFRMSVPVEPLLLEAAQNLMSALQWHGVAMVEFKWNPENQRFALMEINGRFWGSLPLAIAAGADFPAMLYELLVEDSIHARPAAKTGIYGRKLSSDIYWLELVLRKDVANGLVTLPNTRSIVSDLFKFFSPKHHFDVQSWRDPLPGLIDMGQILKSYYQRVRNLIHERRALRAHQQAWHSGQVEENLKKARQILFLCYGNINRSALAERYFNRCAPDADIRIVSAGFHKEGGRPADPVMIEVAAKSGVDLSDWSSKALTPEMVVESDMILVMEQRHYEQIAVEYPEAKDKTFLLGMAEQSSGSNGEIDDPYGKQKTEYEKCAQKVIRCVNKIASMLDFATCRPTD